MIASSESWPSQRGDLRRASVPAALGAALFLVSWGLLHLDALSSFQIVNTGLYERYGDAVLAGQVPYRDFSLEYPPGALPMFILPALAGEGDFRAAFETIQAAMGAGAVAVLAFVLAGIGASRRRLYAAVAFAGLSPLLIGSVVLTRFDLWPALLVVATLAALALEKERLGLGLLGLATAAKIYPLALLPLCIAYVARRKGGREAAVSLCVFAAILGAILLPFGVLSPDGLAESLERQVGRPLQIESLGAALLLLVHRAGGYVPTVVSSHGSQNLSGPAADTGASLSSALQGLAVIGIWVLFAVRARSEEWLRSDLLVASAACVAALVAFGKILSPQFMIWLMVLAPLASGRRGLVAAGLAGAAFVLTHLWFPDRYWDLVSLEPGPAWLVLARNLTLVGLAAGLATAIGRERGATRSG